MRKKREKMKEALIDKDKQRIKKRQKEALRKRNLNWTKRKTK